MKKVLIVIFLLLIIIVTFSFVFLKIEARGNDGNYFNTHLRGNLSRYELARNILGLHYDGDAKADYLGKQTKNITVEVLVMKGLVARHGIIDNLAMKIEKTTGKKTDIAYSFKELPFSNISEKEELAKQLADLRIYRNSSGRSLLYILVVNQDHDQSQIGSTLQENAIILYENNLEQYNLAGNSDALDRYAGGVLLHEFGHQIGLQHNNMSGCLMNPVVELSDRPKTSEIISGFCEYEKKQIDTMNY
jgi:hypothetical protein